MKHLDLNVLLKTMLEKGASDMHISAGSPPAFRINGQILRSKSEPLSAEQTKILCFSLLTDDQKKRFEEELELDFSFGVKDVARLRANLFVQRGTVAGVFRKIPSKVSSLASLGLSDEIAKLADKPNGLVLVTGATGSGKTTTLAALIDQINRKHRGHIITIEDPIEFTHQHGTCIVNQREVGADCNSFSRALRQVLREDPDVIMVGEMRDMETAEAALKAAETGHLVFSTLHTNGAIASINRIVQMFPLDRQEYVQTLLSFTLEAILSQALVETTDKRSRVLVYEYLPMTMAVRNLIREDKLHQVYGQMQISRGKHGMQTMNQCLVGLVNKGLIDYEEALSHSPHPEELIKLRSGGNSTRKAS